MEMNATADDERSLIRRSAPFIRIYSRPRHRAGLFRFRLHHTHCPELGLLLELTHSPQPGRPTEGLATDKPASAVLRKTPAARVPRPHHAYGVARDWICEIDALGRRRGEGLWLTAWKDMRTYAGPQNDLGPFRIWHPRKRPRSERMRRVRSA